METKFEIIWSKESKRQFDKIISYLREEWTEKEVTKFIRKLREFEKVVCLNAPCIDKYLYVNAVKFYESLLKLEKDEQTIKSYQEKIKRTKEQQQLYFKE